MTTTRAQLHGDLGAHSREYNEGQAQTLQTQQPKNQQRALTIGTIASETTHTKKGVIDKTHTDALYKIEMLFFRRTGSRTS